MKWVEIERKVPIAARARTEPFTIAAFWLIKCTNDKRDGMAFWISQSIRSIWWGGKGQESHMLAFEEKENKQRCLYVKKCKKLGERNKRDFYIIFSPRQPTSYRQPTMCLPTCWPHSFAIRSLVLPSLLCTPCTYSVPSTAVLCLDPIWLPVDCLWTIRR